MIYFFMKFNETFVNLKCLQFCHVGINICIFAGRDIKKDNFLCENLLKYIFFFHVLHIQKRI